MMRKAALILITMLVAGETRGQVAPVTDQYILNPVLINPASTGSKGSASIAAFYRRQWAGIKGAPETITLASEAPFNDGRIGLGFSVIRDRVGVTRETAISTSYSYRIDAGNGTVSLGLKAGILTTSTRMSELVVLDPGDDLYLSDSKTFLLPDFGFGAYYTDKKWFAGLSVPRLFGYRFNFEKNGYSIRFNPGDYYYMINTGTLINLSGDLKFIPSLLISLSPGTRTMLDVNSYFVFAEKMWAGLSLRSTGSLGGLFQFAVTDQLKLAYSYHFDFGMLSRFSNGSHEIMLRFDFLYKADVINPLVF